MPAPLRLVPLAVFLLLVVPLVAFCAWRVPAGQVPDEPTHVMRAASLLHGAIIGHRVAALNLGTGARDAGVTGNAGLAWASVAGNGAGARRIPWQPHLSFVSSANTAAYAPVAYIPAALGLGAAILMGANPHAAIIGARCANVIGFALTGALALWLAARGGLLLLIALSLPMTVWLAGSASQDGIVIALTAFGAALLTRGSGVAFWCGCAALAVLVLQKPPFLPLAILPLLVAPARGWGSRWAGAVTVAAPGMLWSVAVAALVSVPLLPGPPYHPGPLWPGDPARLFRSAVPAAQMAVILHHPLRVALLPVTATWREIPSFWLQLVGVLGLLSIRLPRLLYALWSAALLSGVAALMASPRAPGTRWFAAPLAALGVLATIELIFMALYLTWTPVGMTRVDGIQGRYFIPLLPMLLFVVPKVGLLGRAPPWVWWLAPLAAILATDATLPGLIAAQYYP